MPLVPQQDIVTVTGKNAAAAVELLRVKLEAYPDCRIIDTSMGVFAGASVFLIAIIETV